MARTINKAKLACFILTCFFFNLPVMAKIAAEAKSTCTKKMLSDISLASSECISEQYVQLNASIEKRYAEISAKLPDVPSPEANNEYVGLSKQGMNELYSSWKALSR